eukprot:14591500-Heterocapsa_arctica.AAC.1
MGSFGGAHRRRRSQKRVEAQTRLHDQSEEQSQTRNQQLCARPAKTQTIAGRPSGGGMLARATHGHRSSTRQVRSKTSRVPALGALEIGYDD